MDWVERDCEKEEVDIKKKEVRIMGNIADRLRRRYAERSGTAPATRNDLASLRRELDHNLRRYDPNRMSGGQIMGRTVRMARRGLADVNKSLSTPHDETRRPRISQLPAKRKDMGISASASLDFLKMPGLRGQNISGIGMGKKKKGIAVRRFTL